MTTPKLGVSSTMWTWISGSRFLHSTREDITTPVAVSRTGMCMCSAGLLTSRRSISTRLRGSTTRPRRAGKLCSIRERH